jgi:hypothetical protein
VHNKDRWANKRAGWKIPPVLRSRASEPLIGKFGLRVLEDTSQQRSSLKALVARLPPHLKGG